MQSRMPCAVVSMLSLLLSGLAGAQDYQWTEIVIPGATVLQAWQINDKGQVALSTTDGRSGIYGDGTFTPLPPPPEGLQVGALGINNDCVITGSATAVTGTQQGFILRGSTYTLFSRPGWVNTQPRAIANFGLITGYSFGTGGTPAEGFIYDPDTGTFTDATPPGSNFTITQGMNAFGRITGSGQDPTIRYGFVWQQETIAQGKRELLPFLDRIKIDATAATRGINDSGVVVGWIADATGRNNGIVGSDALGYQRLIAPGGELPGNSTVCQSINSLAQVVCYVWDSASNPQGAFIGSPVGGEANVDSSSRPASTRDIAASSGAAKRTNKPREELVIPTMQH